LNFELAILKGLGLKEIDVFRGDYLVAIRGIVAFVESDFELLFHLGDGFRELENMRLITCDGVILSGLTLRVKGARVFIVWRTLKADSSFPSSTGLK
jgi:hypothetical protein